MGMILLSLFLFLVGAPLRAGNTANGSIPSAKGSTGKANRRAKHEMRTFSEMIGIAFAHGKERLIKVSSGGDLGFSQNVTSKALVYKNESNYRRLFHVVYDNGNLKPESVVLMVIKKSKTNSGENLDAWSFRTNLDGSLRNAAHGGEVSGRAFQNPVSTDSGDAKKEFASAMHFFLGTPAGLEYNK